MNAPSQARLAVSSSLLFFSFFSFFFVVHLVGCICIFIVGSLGLAEYWRTQLCDPFLESTYPTILWQLLGTRGLVGVGGSDPNRPPPTEWRTGWGCDQFKYPIHFELCRPRRRELSWYVHKEVDTAAVYEASVMFILVHLLRCCCLFVVLLQLFISCSMMSEKRCQGGAIRGPMNLLKIPDMSRTIHVNPI